MKATADSFNSRLRESDEARIDLLRDQHVTHEKGLKEQRQRMVAIEREKLDLFREFEERKLQLKAKEIELKRREQEAMEVNQILQLDTSNLEDDAKEYYRLMRKKLIAKAREDE